MGDPASGGQHLKDKRSGGRGGTKAAEKTGSRAAPSLRALLCCSYTSSFSSKADQFQACDDQRSGGDACGVRELLTPQINACNLRFQFLVSFWLRLAFVAA